MEHEDQATKERIEAENKDKQINKNKQTKPKKPFAHSVHRLPLGSKGQSTLGSSGQLTDEGLWEDSDSPGARDLEDVVAHAFNPRSWKAETGGCL